MSEMSEFKLDLPAEKQAGQLITSQDWNKLIRAVASLGEQVETEINDLRESMELGLAKLDEKITNVAGRVTELEGPVAVLEQQYRVTLESTELRFPLGEVAEITARVFDFEGNPLDMSGGRPWVDFVTGWGQFKAVGGFTTRGGQGDRTMSVQVNNQGIARIQLRSESVEGLSDEDDDALVGFLNTPVNVATVAGQSMMPVSQAIMSAASPVALQTNSGAFQFMNTQYQQASSPTFNTFVDNFYIQQPGIVANWTGSFFQNNWHDYRANVMAIAKADGDPRTPDAGRGFSSIQITFRDWVSPWVNMGWLGSYQVLLPDLVANLDMQIVPDMSQTMVGLQQQVQNMTAEVGILGRLQGFMALSDALDRVPLAGKPGFTEDVLGFTKDMVHMQQVMEVSQAHTAGVKAQAAAMDAFGAAALQQAKQAADAQSAIGGIIDSMGGIREMAEGVVAGAEGRIGATVTEMERRLEGKFGEVEGRLDRHGGLLETHGSSLNLLDGRTEALQQSSSMLVNDVSAVAGKVTVLENFNVIDVQDKLATVVTLQTQLQDATMELGALRELITP